MLLIFEQRVGEGSRKTRKTRKATIELPNMNETLILIHSGSALLDWKPLFVAFGKPNGHLPFLFFSVGVKLVSSSKNSKASNTSNEQAWWHLPS